MASATREAVQDIQVARQGCIQECQDCHSICLETIRYLRAEDGDDSLASDIALLLDCAEIWQTSADFMLPRSELHPQVCSVCALVCECCAEACDQFQDNPLMLSCAEVCRTCARSCRRMAASAGMAVPAALMPWVGQGLRH